jgi:hypothetical protein
MSDENDEQFKGSNSSRGSIKRPEAEPWTLNRA